MNLSFAGCGFLGIYHIGVGVCLQKYAPHLLLHKISGASAGAIAACCLLCDVPIGVVASDMLNLIREARQRTLGPFSPSINVQEYLFLNLNKVLPSDAHERVNGKLHISLTRIPDGKNVLVSHFESRDDLLQALLASTFIPIFSGFFPPTFHGERYIDGGFSDNLPTLDENTITVSPFCGETDICPRDVSSQMFHINFANTSIELSKQNAYRFARIIWPPKVQILSKLCKQGFDDALRFLQRNNLINCTRCVAVQSTFVLSEAVSEASDYDPQCQDCKLHREVMSDQHQLLIFKLKEAFGANLPDAIAGIFQDAIDSANKGFYNWMLSYRSMKVMSILSLPYAIPFDLAMATLKKILTLLPSMNGSVRSIYEFCSSVVMHILRSVIQNPSQEHHPANVMCQMAYTEIGYDDEVAQFFDKELNFKLDIDKSEFETTSQLTANEILSRANVSKKSEIHSGEDTIDDILRVTSSQNPIVKFSYLDDDNKVKITEIFDVTDSSTCHSESSSIGDPHQIHASSPWKLHDYKLNSNSCSFDENSSTSISDSMDYARIFSDPESEWISEDVGSLPLDLDDIRPESDQN